MRLPLCATLLLVAAAAASCSAVAAAVCVAPLTSDSITPANPGFTIPSGAVAQGSSNVPEAGSGGFINAGCSEKVTVYTQTMPYTGEDSTVASSISPSLDSWPRVNCPHLDSSLTSFATAFPAPAPESELTIATGSNLLLRACDLPDASQTDPSWILKRLIVSSGASLVLDDAPLLLRVREIVVESGGRLLAGSATCRLFTAGIRIVFHGSKATSSQANPFTANGPTLSFPSKGLLASGIVDMHAKLYFPTWTRLSRSVGGPAQSGEDASVIFLQEAVNWEVGQRVLVTSTILFDCGSGSEDAFCRPCWNGNCPPVPHQNEVRTIVALAHSPNMPSASVSRFSALRLDAPLSFAHYGGREYQAEVALLDRRIVLEGSDSGDRFGGHVQVMGPSAEGRFSGVRVEGMGQLNQLGRYPLHFHLMGTSAGAANSYVQDSSITNSHFRCAVIHGTNSTRLSRNTAFNVTGMCYYLEDGVEENNLLEYNLAAHIHPIFRAANGGYGQGGETFSASAALIIPADTSAAGFYALNANNAFIANSVSGGWCGFAFPNAPRPVGDYKDTLTPTSVWNPLHRPLKRFIGNSAHSTGYHWVEHGSAVYVGAWLDYDTNGLMRYNSGRNDRDTKYANGTSAVMLFEHTKVFLSNKGLAHWGNTVKVQHAEFYDVRVSAMLFGEASMINVLVVGQTPNLKSEWLINRGKMGFQTYDTWVQTILSGMTFRNYSATPSQYAINNGFGQAYAFRYMDHSDQFTPQGLNSVRGIRFEHTPPLARLGIDHCGPDCGNQNSTMSSRIYTVWDWDGSMSGRGVPTILGGHERWWDNSPQQNCAYLTERKVWVCDWNERATVGFIAPSVAGLDNGCDAAITNACGSQYSPYTVGSVTQWGAAATYGSRSILLSPWPGVAGIVNTGWHWRVKTPAGALGIDGAPSAWQIEDTYQLPRGSFVVLSINYPATTTFSINIKSKWYNTNGGVLATYPLSMSADLATVLTPTENLNAPSTFTCGPNWYDMCTYSSTGGVGPAWFFDAASSTLYVRVVNPQCYNKNDRTRCSSDYTAGGVSVPDTRSTGFLYQIAATCSGCAVQSSYAGVNYFTVANNAPATRFATDYGAVRTAPQTPAVENQAWTQCAAPAPAPADPPADTPAGSSSSTAENHGPHGNQSSSSTGTMNNATGHAAALSLSMMAALCILLSITPQL